MSTFTDTKGNDVSKNERHNKFEIETSIDQVTDRLKEDSRIDIENGNIDIGGLKTVQNEVNNKDVNIQEMKHICIVSEDCVRSI